MAEETELSIKITQTKEYLSDTRCTIKLEELVKLELQNVLSKTSEDNFSIQRPGYSVEEFTRRLEEYELIVADLLRISCCIAHWGKPEHLHALKRALEHITVQQLPAKPIELWQALRWYPAVLLLYSTGISAIAHEKYDNLAAILLAKVRSLQPHKGRDALTPAIGEPIEELCRVADLFKNLPGRKKDLVPRSEYLFEKLKPMLDDLLSLEPYYELYFDQFEVLLALVYADVLGREGLLGRGPVGRFGYKYAHYRDINPLKNIIAEAGKYKESWGPLAAGLFGGSYSRFEQISSEYEKVIARHSEVF